LTEFFRIIRIDDEITNNDAEGKCHHLHHERLKIGAIYDFNEGQVDTECRL